jgi:hypothetical protein
MGFCANGFRLCPPLGVGECAHQLVGTAVVYLGANGQSATIRCNECYIL